MADLIDVDASKTTMKMEIGLWYDKKNEVKDVNSNLKQMTVTIM